MSLFVKRVLYIIAEIFAKKLTSSETVVPPVSSAEIRLEIVGGSRDDDDGRRDQGPDAQEHTERQDDDAEALQQTRVRYFYGLRRLHSEDHGYSANVTNPLRIFSIFPQRPYVSPRGLINCFKSCTKCCSS